MTSVNQNATTGVVAAMLRHSCINACVTSTGILRGMGSSVCQVSSLACVMADVRSAVSGAQRILVPA